MQVADCQAKLARADRLIGGLGGERLRWQQQVEQLDRDLGNVVGDVVVAAGVGRERAAMGVRSGLGRGRMQGNGAYSLHSRCAAGLFL